MKVKGGRKGRRRKKEEERTGSWKKDEGGGRRRKKGEEGKGKRTMMLDRKGHSTKTHGKEIQVSEW